MNHTQNPSTVIDRENIYYWKCDRENAFHGSRELGKRDASKVLREVEDYLGEALKTAVSLRPSSAPGNHLTAIARIGKEEWFARIEDGPEQDPYMEVESRLLRDLADLDIPTPAVRFCDASRQHIPYAIQVLENIPHPTLNDCVKANETSPLHFAQEIGASVARWQEIDPGGYGPMRVSTLRDENRFEGCHRRYPDYFHLHLDDHLCRLVEGDFLSLEESKRIHQAIRDHKDLLELDHPCLVHKDLAFWNILGTSQEIAAFIDWDDAIGGDPMDDLSLLACFYGPEVVAKALAGYQTVRNLPENHALRLWIHWLRNMIVKSVIRLGAGYFDQSENLFLMNAGQTGSQFRDATRLRLFSALSALEENRTEIYYDF